MLDGLAKQKKQKLNWRTSIVDLMKLLDLDSSATARKHLAEELHYQGDMKKSAKMNVWLHTGDDQARRKWREGPRRIEAPTVAVTECRITTDQSRRPLCCAMFATFFLLILWARCRYVFNFLQRRIVTRFA